MIDLGIVLTQQQFGDLVGISQPAVSDLLSRSVLPAGASGFDWIRAYCGHLRETAAGRAALGDLDLVTERAGLAKAQRERIELQNAVTRSELAPVILIEEVLTKAAAKVAGTLDAIPGMVRRRVPQLTADDIDLIAAEVAKARNTVAAMSLSDVNDDDVDQGDAPDFTEAEEAP